MAQKNIQIDMNLFINLLDYFFPYEDTEDYELELMSEDIKEALKEKLEAINKRNAFTNYKTCKDKDMREELRREYLNIAEISKNYRSEKEYRERG